jgi:hypothetical protein
LAKNLFRRAAFLPEWSRTRLCGFEFSAKGSSDTAADYAYVGRPQRAFVSWDKKIGVPAQNDVSGLFAR